MSYVLAFLLMLAPLVVVHELGHFLMAKLGGIKVTKFAFGFGPRLFGFEYKGTDYRWNLLPLGGYVDFMGEVVYTNRIPDDMRHFYNRPKFLRFLVLVMGPMFNLVLALGLYWLFFGARPVYEPIHHGAPYTVGLVQPDSAEAQAGLQPGDRIEAINGEPVAAVEKVIEHMLFNPGKPVTLSVVRGGQALEIAYDIPEDPIEGVGQFNFAPWYRPQVSEAVAEKPAALAGMQAGDVIVAVNGEAVAFGGSESRSVPELLNRNAPGPSEFTVLRDGRELSLSITPEQGEEGKWLVGISYGPESVARDLNAGEALGRAWSRFLADSTMIFRGVKKLIVGDLPLKTLSSPIGVGRVAKQALDYSVWQFLLLMAVISVNLGILNLLPIPVLDGGEIFVLLTEWVARRDFSLVTKMKIKLAGFFFLVGLMGVVIIMDVVKIYQAAQV